MRSPSYLIREARESDYSGIAQIYNEYLGIGTMDQEPFTAEDMKNVVRHGENNEFILVLENEARLIGWSRIKRYSPKKGYAKAAETTIFLTKTGIGRGAGKDLYTALISKARIQGYHHLAAKIFADNIKSIEFHKNLGFKIVGLQKEIGYVNGVWKDVVILQYLINHNP